MQIGLFIYNKITCKQFHQFCFVVVVFFIELFQCLKQTLDANRTAGAEAAAKHIYSSMFNTIPRRSGQSIKLTKPSLADEATTQCGEEFVLIEQF